MTDAVLTSLIPTGGIASVLVIVIVYLLRQNHADRVQYRGDVAASEARHVREVKALEERHVHEMQSVRDELVKLREDIGKSLTELEEERRKRWAAEDTATRYRRQLEEAGVQS